MIDYNFKELVRILTKIDTNICLLMPNKCTKFQPDQSTNLRVRADFVICAKRQKKKKPEEPKLKLWSLVSRKRRRDLLQFRNPASPYRRAVPQQIW